MTYDEKERSKSFSAIPALVFILSLSGCGPIAAMLSKAVPTAFANAYIAGADDTLTCFFVMSDETVGNIDLDAFKEVMAETMSEDSFASTNESLANAINPRSRPMSLRSAFST